MKFWLAIFFTVAVPPLAAQSDAHTLVEMNDRGASTFYVNVQMAGTGMKSFLVDTGSSYTTINEKTLAELIDSEQAEHVRNLEGVLADGSTQIVPLYSIKSLTIGEDCALGEVQAAVFPGETRNILGLSALRSAAPFVFSVDPPTLALSNCGPRKPVTIEMPGTIGAK